MRDMTPEQVEAHNARVRAGRMGMAPVVPTPPPTLTLRPRASVMAVGRTARGVIALTLPVPPTTNLAYVHVAETGRRVLTKVGRQFKKAAKKTIQGEALVQRWGYSKGQRLALRLTLYFPTTQRRDISNCVKLVEDSLAEVLGFDDSAVDLLLVQRAGVDHIYPRCEVGLEVL